MFSTESLEMIKARSVSRYVTVSRGRGVETAVSGSMSFLALCSGAGSDHHVGDGKWTEA